MKKVLSVILALILVISSMSAVLSTPASAVPVTTPVLTDPNLAKDYTVANGDLVLDATSNPKQKEAGVYDYTDPVETIFGNSGGSKYSWRFGVTSTDVGKNIINANGLKPNTKYYFSYIYSRDYQIVLDGVKDSSGNYVFEGFTADSATVTYPQGVTVNSHPSNQKRIKKVECYFTTNDSTDYDIILKTSKNWRTEECNWDHVRLSDLMLAECGNNLAADYEYKEDGTGNIVIPTEAKLVASNPIASTVNGGKSFRMKGTDTNVEVPVTIKAKGLKANTVYSFSWVYSNDYKVQLSTSNPVIYSGDAMGNNNIDVATSSVATMNISGGQGAVLNAFSFTTLGAGDYTINLVFAKGWMNAADPTNSDWDSTYLSDIRLVESGQYDNLIADYTMTGGEITFQNREGIWNKDKYGGDFSGYWWKLPYINHDVNFNFNINIDTADIEPNTYYQLTYNCGSDLYTKVDAEKTTGITILRDNSGEKSSFVIFKTGDDVSHCTVSLKYAKEAYDGAASGEYAAAVISNLCLTKSDALYTVRATADGKGDVSVSSATCEAGEQSTFTATADKGAKFVGWFNGDILVSDEETYTAVINGDTTLVAKFEIDDVIPEYADAGNAIRAYDSALRFKFKLPNEMLTSYNEMATQKVGLLIIPTAYLEGDDLVVGGKYSDKNYVPIDIEVLTENHQHYDNDTSNTYFTAALYNIDRNGTAYYEYKTAYTVRPYVVCKDANGDDVVYYGDAVSASMVAVMNAILTENKSEYDVGIVNSLLENSQIAEVYNSAYPAN